MTHTPSPIEQIALDRVADLDRLEVLMYAQHAKGRAEHEHEIDLWGEPRIVALAEGGCELVDLLTYFSYAGGVPDAIYENLNAVGVWLNQELQAHP